MPRTKKIPLAGDDLIPEAYITPGTSLQAVERLSRDLANSAKLLTKDQARLLVTDYYLIQEHRIATGNQTQSLKRAELPVALVNWLSTQLEVLENQVKAALFKFAASEPLGQWLMSIHGISGVLAAGLIANIDIEKAPTVGHIWRFAGLDPTSKWTKGEKRPWNADLKLVCWKVSESFVMVKNAEADVYGKLYDVRKAYEEAKNEAGDYKEQAAAGALRVGKDTDAYKAYIAGVLPKGHIHSRAKRYAVKIFLSHLHYVAYRLHYGVEPPKPFAIAILGHAHEIPVPNLSVVGLS